MYYCYRYLEKFHVEPLSWFDLFDFLEYNLSEKRIAEYLASLKIKE